MAVDAEKLIALKPQIVYVNDINLASSESVWKQVEDAGITVVNIPTSTSIKAIKEDVHSSLIAYLNMKRTKVNQNNGSRNRRSSENW